LIDFVGAIVELYAFDAYGNAIGFDPSVALTEFLYSGEQFDSKIGQQYLRARYYDPATGRFNRLDPFFGNLNDPQTFHKYLYTHADPVNGIDQSGMMMTGPLASASIAAHIASVKMATDLNVLIAVNTTVDGVRAGLTQGQIFERYMRDLGAGGVIAYGLFFAPGIIAGVIRIVPQNIKKFIADKFTGLWNHLARISSPICGQVLGQGGRKIVYGLSHDPNLVVAVPKALSYADDIKKELDILGKLDCMGFPVPRVVGVTEVNGMPAYVMQKYAQGSKEIVKTIDGIPTIVGSSPYLNQKSVQDLKTIKQMMQDKNIRINDLQFLIGQDGRIVIADPIDVIIGMPPSSNNLRTINKLIRVAGGTP
jgi:RHS repeat-associated protein